MHRAAKEFFANRVAPGARHGARRAAAVLLLALAMVWPDTDANAQAACAPIGTDQTCTNSGPISGGAVGIEDSGSLNLLNTSAGNVVGDARGIVATSANVTNFGTIQSRFGFGIDSSTVNLVNSGLVSGTSAVVGTVVSIVNSGTLTGQFSGISGAVVTVTNAGTISGNSGTGVISLGDVTLINTGTISAREGIFASGSGNITNSGLLIGTNGAAMLLNFFSGPVPDVLTLLPGSQIVGGIILGGGGDTVNVQGGNNNLTFDTLAGATVTSTTPSVVAGNQVATIDATPFAQVDRNLLDFTRLVSAAIPVSNNGAVLCTPLQNVSDEPATQSRADGSMVRYCDGRTFWTAIYGGERDQSAGGQQVGSENNFYGSMVGGDWRYLTNLKLGAFAGVGRIRSSVDFDLSRDTSDLVFGGLYGRYKSGPALIAFSVQGGHSSTDTKRNVNNNLAPGGLEVATADYDAWYFSPEVDFGASVRLGAGSGMHFDLTPSIRLRYLYASLDGYAESGSMAPLTIGSRDVSDFEERAQLKLTGTRNDGPMGGVTASIYGGVIGIQRAGDSTIDATLLGQAIPFARPGSDDVWGGFGGGEAEFRSGNVSLFISGEYSRFSDDSSILNGQGGFRIRF